MPIYFTGSAFNGGTITNPIQVPLGTVGAPSIQFADADTGFYSPTVNVDIAAVIAGTERLRISSGSGGGIFVTTYVDFGSPDIALQRDAAQILGINWGTAANCFRVYNTRTSLTNREDFSIDWITTANSCLVGPEVGSAGGTPRAVIWHGADSVGTNVAGALNTVRGALGTGTATPALTVLTAAAQGTASGTTVHTAVERVVLNGTKALTSGAAASLFDIILPASAMAGGILVFSIEATDGTDFLAESGSVYFGAVNKAGAYTTNSSILGTNALAKSDAADLISTTFGFSNGANKTTLQVTSTLTNMTATTFRITYQIISGSQNAVTPV